MNLLENHNIFQCACYHFFYHFRPMFRLLTYIIILQSIILSDVSRRVLKSDSQELIIEYNINAETESDLYPISLLIGLPTQDFPDVSISFENYSIIPFDSQQEIKKSS